MNTKPKTPKPPINNGTFHRCDRCDPEQTRRGPKAKR